MQSVRRLLRTSALVLVAVVGTALLMTAAPGYFTDAREMDAAHAASARAELQELKEQQGTTTHWLLLQLRQWSHGDLGLSRQYDLPVATLVRERTATSLRLLLYGVSLGWSGALVLAVPLSMRRSSLQELLLACVTALLLAVPVSLLAVLSLLANTGGPAFVLALLVGVRDFKIVERTTRAVWTAPHILHARAGGLSAGRIAVTHVAATLRSELFALAVVSFTLALSALVPVEVVFDVPGLGQLAWSAAMNRDLPVLVTITALMAGCIGFASNLASGQARQGQNACA